MTYDQEGLIPESSLLCGFAQTLGPPGWTVDIWESPTVLGSWSYVWIPPVEQIKADSLSQVTAKGFFLFLKEL